MASTSAVTAISRALKLLLLLAASLVLLPHVAVGQDMPEVQVEWDHSVDFSQFHTYTWAKEFYPIHDGIPNLGMRHEVAHNLEAKGLQWVDPDGKAYDVFVTYNAQIISDARDKTREAVVLRVRIFDSRNNNQIWRAGGTLWLGDNDAENIRQVRRMLDAMFESFPPAAQSSMVPAGTPDADTIRVQVWSSTEQNDSAQLSRSFAVAGLGAASRMQLTQRQITNSIRLGFPLGGGFWIQTELDAIDDAVRVATLCAANDADRRVLQELQAQASRLREWCDWLVEEERNMRLANYLTSPEPLQNDERFQDTVSCTRLLLSTLASRRLQEEDHCS